jgi:hypothetical protein
MARPRSELSDHRRRVAQYGAGFDGRLRVTTVDLGRAAFHAD